MNQRPRVLLLIPHLGGGGAERVMALVARGLSREKYELHLGLMTQTDAAGAGLPSWFAVHALGAARVRGAAFRLIRLVRTVKPDLILSGMFHLNFLVLLLRPFFPRRTRILIRQNGTVSSSLAWDGLPRFTGLLYKVLYRHADRIVCQSRAMAADLTRELGIGAESLSVLPNPVDVEKIRNSIRKAPTGGNGPWLHLFAVGRLSREKGFDLLLQALFLVRVRIPGVGLVIAGAGPEENALKVQCHQLGLDEAVEFAGPVDHPFRYFPSATLFVLSSRHEGLPNALLEAAAAGLPLVAVPSSQGVVDLLRGQPGAWLAREISAQALAASLLTAMEALQPGERFTHSFVDEFRLDRAIPAYENLIDATLREKKS
jgi:glycosyltransferase involved in cell wall biosynthesis